MAGKGTCKMDGCRQGARGKGYCDRHYRAWKRGKLPKGRYRSCNDAKCTARVARRGLCTVHFDAAYGRKKQAASSGAEAGAG